MKGAVVQHEAANAWADLIPHKMLPNWALELGYSFAFKDSATGVLAGKPDDLSSSLQGPHGGRIEPTLAKSPLTSTYTP